jgi:hypothetical protein
MSYRYPLPPSLAQQVTAFEEFASGAAQCRARLRDGSSIEGLLCNGSALIARQAQAVLPFRMEDVDSLFQTDEDRTNYKRTGWVFFDEWST